MPNKELESKAHPFIVKAKTLGEIHKLNKSKTLFPNSAYVIKAIKISKTLSLALAKNLLSISAMKIRETELMR